MAPRRAWSVSRVHDLWRFRELLYFLVWRDVKVRYKQTALGAAWAVLQPALAMIVFTVFFGRLAGVPSDRLPYSVFALAGLIPWTYFSTALASGSGSIAAQQQVISKVYFPRLLIPLAGVLSPLADTAIACGLLAVVMAWFHIVPGAAMVWIPALVALAILTALAASFWLSALSVRYRDIRYVLPFLAQIWMFATPVAYPASLVPERWRAWYGLNPMAGVVEGFRWALVGGPSPGWMTFVSAGVVLAALVGGVLFFDAVEGTFADVV